MIFFKIENKKCLLVLSIYEGITGLHLPGGLGIRVDCGVYEQAIVQPYYDSLVAKLIARGRDRETAIRRMRRALGECVIEGIDTTLPLHRRLMEAEFFLENRFHTRFLETWLADNEEGED